MRKRSDTAARCGLAAAVILTALCAAGCGGGGRAAAGFVESVEQNSHGDYTYRKEFGTYTVLDGWVESETYSTDDKFFYVQEGHEDDAQPDNISVNVDTNRYSADEFEKFRDAIVAQLMEQISGSGAQLNGSGSYTAADDVLLTLEVIDTDGVVTRQYYIVGDYRYCLIHLTNYSGDENADETAAIMADSFVWRN